MTISMYKASVPIFVQFLTSLSAWLDKAAAHAEAKKIDPAVLLNTRLFPDMFPLARQVRAATDHAINACGRLAGVELPTFANTEASIPELEERVAKTIEFIKAIKPAQIDGSEDKEITMKFASGERKFSGQSLLLNSPAELLFSCHDRLRHPASEWRRARQAGLHGNGAPTLAAAMCPRPVPGSGRIARMVRNDRWELIWAHDGKCSACQSASRFGLILPSMTKTPGAPSATHARTGSRSASVRTVAPRAP